MANLIITNSCNRNCSYCFARGTGTESGGISDMSNDSFSRILDLVCHSGMDELRLLGGEPSLHPNFISFLKQGLNEDLNIRVFSNGLMSEETISELIKLDNPRINFIINSIDPDTHPEEHHLQCSTLSKLGNHASIGINILHPGQNLDYLIPMIDRNGSAREIRIGLAHPTVPPVNQFLHPKFYQIVGRRLGDFFQEASEKNVKIELDCGFVPCMFPEEMKDLLDEQYPDIGSRCNPVLDILPDEEVISCFPLKTMGGKRLADFSSTGDIRESFLRKWEPFKSTGIYPYCVKCELFISEICLGGCRAHVINRFSGKNIKAGKTGKVDSEKVVEKEIETDRKKKTNHPKKWTIPYIDQPVEFWDKIQTQYEGLIEGVYFPLSSSVLGSGRPVQAQQHMDAFLRDSGINKTLIINPIILPDKIENIGGKIIEEIEKLHKLTPLNEITLTSPLLAQLIKKEFPDIPLTASTLMDIQSSNQLTMLGGTFQKIVPSGRILRNRNALRNLKRNFEGEIRLLVNEACIPGCLSRTQHFFEMGSSSVPHPESLCNEMLANNPWMRLTGAWILPQFLDLYENLCDEFKLAGRVSLQDPVKYMNVLSQYIHRKNLKPSEIGGGPASPPEWISVSRAFFEHTLTCDHMCSSCNYCREYWEKGLKGETTILDEQIQKNRHLFSSSTDLDAIREDWRKIPGDYNYRSKSMPSPEWREHGLTESSAESWSILREKISRASKSPMSVYIHVPFCDRRCNFCDCHTTAVPKGNKEKLDHFTTLLVSEIGLWTDDSALPKREISTIHFGGGTPNYLPIENLKRIFGKLKESLWITQNTEFALESTGNLLTETHINDLYETGFSRLHVGIQTMNNTTRKLLGRKETSEEILRRLENALQRGFTVSVDIIYGLPGQQVDSLINTLSLLVDAGIHGFSLYHLNITDQNRIFFDKLKGFSRDVIHDYLLFQAADQFLLHKGYRKNHFVHYALEQDKNLYYNHVHRGEDLLSLGPTSDGFFDDYYYVHEWIDEYMSHHKLRYPPIKGGGYISVNELALRPLKAQLLGSAVSEDAIHTDQVQGLFNRWMDDGLVTYDKGIYQLTGTGSWFIDRMSSELMKHGI